MMTIISRAVLIEQLKRFWPLALLASIGYLLLVILPIYVPGWSGDYQESARAVVEVLSMRHNVVMAATVLMPFSAVMVLFSFLFDERASIVFFGFSDNKNQLFWTNTATGLILILAPLLVLLLALLLVGVRHPGSVDFPIGVFPNVVPLGSVINSFPVVLFFFLRLVVSYIFYFALFLLAVSLAGNGLSAVLLSVTLPFLPAVFHRVIMLIASVYVIGLDIYNSFPPENIVRYTNPLMWYWNFDSLGQGIYFLIYAGVAVVVLVLSNICFHYRKIERIGEPVVFELCKTVLIFLMSFVGMIAMGRFLLTLVTGRWLMYIGFAIGFAITFCIAHMIFEKNFNVFHKLESIITSAIVAAVIYGVIMLILMFGTRFFTHNVPLQQSVTGVYSSQEGPWTEERVFVTNPEVITRTLAMHRLIVDDSCYLYNVLWQSMSGGGRQFAATGGRHLYLAYQLQDSEIMFRRYALSGDFIVRWGLSGAFQ